ncbi:hypothetical protein LJR098_001235 [Rhizobium sp. LjRoot98]|nr:MULTISPECIES: hypothetical protein [unclassified Rhizobium]
MTMDLIVRPVAGRAWFLGNSNPAASAFDARSMLCKGVNACTKKDEE